LKKKQLGNLIKNQDYHVRITDIGTKGEGIGHIDGIPIFVEGAIPEDEIMAKIIFIKSNFVVGKLITINTPSAYRTDLLCSKSPRCGGCQIQAMAYHAQIMFKMKKITDSMARIGKLPVENILPMIEMDKPVNYRNKAQFAIQGQPDNPQVGLYVIRTHRIIDLAECGIQHPIVSDIIARVKAYIQKSGVSIYDEASHTGLIRHVLIRTSFTQSDALVCLIINGTELSTQDELIKNLRDVASGIFINTNTNPGDTILGKSTQLLFGNPYIEEQLLQMRFAISPASFFQVNPIQAEKLISNVLEFANLTGNEIVWDAYCGIGTFTLFLAQNCKKVIGVEAVESAIEDARQNASLNGLTNIEWMIGPCETVFETINEKPDLIIVDPPRKGLDLQFLNTLINVNAPRIIYVSCNPDTLARDLAILVKAGYQLKKLQPIDMFPHTVHIESVTLLEI